MINLKTRDFGEIAFDEGNIIHFQEPIFGFEEYKEFVFLTDEDIGEDFVWLQSAEDPELCFILISPEAVMENYCPQIPRKTQELLGEEDYMCWLMVVLKESLQESTVNLKSPVVVNPVKKLAAQVILEEDLPMRYPLVRKEEDC